MKVCERNNPNEKRNQLKFTLHLFTGKSTLDLKKALTPCLHIAIKNIHSTFWDAYCLNFFLYKTLEVVEFTM